MSHYVPGLDQCSVEQREHSPNTDEVTETGQQ